jgi:hypothetical protein
VVAHRHAGVGSVRSRDGFLVRSEPDENRTHR